MIATNPHQALLSVAKQNKVLSESNVNSTVSEPTGIDISSFLRTITQMSLRSLAWRDTRAHMLLSDISLLNRLDLEEGNGNESIPSSSNFKDEPCLSVSGYIRGAPLHVDQLIHVPGMGARRIIKILSSNDPCPMKEIKKRNLGGQDMMADGNVEDVVEVLAVGNPSRGDPLHIWATPNTLIGEQTWPDMDEYEQGMNDDDNDDDVMKKKKPAGVSDYQATWMGGSDDENDDDDEEDRDGKHGGWGLSLGSKEGKKKLLQSGEDGEEDEEDEEGQFSFLQSEGGLKLDGLVDMTPEELAADKEARKRARANEDLEFPDEVDVPDDMLAKDRFARLVDTT